MWQNRLMKRVWNVKTKMSLQQLWTGVLHVTRERKRHPLKVKHFRKRTKSPISVQFAIGGDNGIDKR